jgi:hypothetical protein
MAKKKSRSLVDRLQTLLDALNQALTPRQPAPVPVPVRSEKRRR